MADQEHYLWDAYHRNERLREMVDAGARLSMERDVMRIATLEARLHHVEERHRATMDAARVDRERLSEVGYLVESLGATIVDY